ncbi:integrase core domain-containing protein [Sphingomonas sp. SORGH_AS_0950]|uniref:integrase core domain-containing protein n=1 Tax=Sphingomonas sp. SORGH_AS_0950 TaxID=3041792 RepID=UPI0035902A8F
MALQPTARPEDPRLRGLHGRASLRKGDTRVKYEARKRDYNEHRPHSSLGNQTPVERDIPQGRHTCAEGRRAGFLIKTGPEMRGDSSAIGLAETRLAGHQPWRIAA